jgi:ribosomal protein L11 methylase PrmA
MKNNLVSGSFRDPKGHVYIKGQRVFRTVTAKGIEDFKALKKTGILDHLVNEGLLVPWNEVLGIDLDGDERNAVLILEHEFIDFISYPYEWSFSSLKAAALLHLKIQIKCLEKGVTLSDSSAYNIQFINAKPIFIDHLSFKPYQNGEFWVGHDQFCRQFLNPLLLRSKLGIRHNEWFRGGLEGIPTQALASLLPWYSWLSPLILMHVKLPAYFERVALRKKSKNVDTKISKTTLPRQSYARMLHSLKNGIENLSVDREQGTAWSSYTSTTSYNESEAESKRAFITEFAAEVRPSMLWDIGCNTAEYTAVALAAGAKKAIGFEFDSGAIEAAYSRADSEGLSLLPLYLDAANPTPSQGWRQSERDGLAERVCADGLIALAVIHHLCIGKNIPLRQVVEWLISLAPQGVIEFVPKDDPKVKELLKFREDIFDDYTWPEFEQEILRNAKTIKTEKITSSGRKLVWYSRIS